MREALLDVLACPLCQAPLELDPRAARSEGRVRSGVLECSGCGAAFPVSGGVPRLLPRARLDGGEDERRTAAHFTAEFSGHAEGDRDMDPPRLLEYQFFARTGIDPDFYAHWSGDPYSTVVPDESSYRPDGSFLKGKRVLDAGCGPGRFTRVAAADADHVVGLDLGDHVDRAAARCADLANVDLVQGSVLEPPFRAGAFDFVFSVGVLHHTPDPRRGCLELAALLAPGGVLAVWIYPPEYWGGPLREPLGRLLHAHLSRLPPERSLALCERWLYPLGRVQMRLARRRWTKLLAAPLFLLSVPRHPSREVMITTIHDYFGPPIISTHGYGELEGWLAEAGLGSVRRLPVPTSCIAERSGARVG